MVAEQSHNQSILAIRSEYDKAAVNSISEDIASQQNALRSQQELLQTHEATLRHVTELQKDQEESLSTIQSLRKEIQSLKETIENGNKELDANKKVSAKQCDSLKQQLELSKLMLQEKVDAVERLKESGREECQQNESNDQVVTMQAGIRRLNLAQTIARFGEAPVVQFWIRSPDKSADSFEVQIEIQEMPHSVYTFLNLVDAGFYHATEIVSNSDNDEIVGGKASGKLKSKLLRKYAEAGYGIHPLLFTELSTAQYDHSCFGILSRGPDFAIGNSLTSCFGRVIAGQDVLDTLISATIVDTRILQYKHDEL